MIMTLQYAPLFFSIAKLGSRRGLAAGFFVYHVSRALVLLGRKVCGLWTFVKLFQLSVRFDGHV
jgi:hypothetical protein